MIEIKCAGCGKNFQADEKVERAYCLYCGHANMIGAAVVNDQTVDPDQERYLEWKKAIENVRFKIWNKKTGEKGDTFIGFWSMLIFHGRNSRGFFGLKRASREANKFWQQSVIGDVLIEAGDQAKKLISEQLYDSARAFYQTCREDRHYGSKMLDMVKLKPEQIADKAAAEVSEQIFSYWLKFEPISYRDEIFRAAWFAFSSVFTEKSDALAERVSRLPADERRLLSEIIGVPL